jgi:hypothetical protein
MFDLQLPRHISTLPIATLTAVQIYFRFWGNSGSHAAPLLTQHRTCVLHPQPAAWRRT